jgi:hypothetical protein
VRLTFEVLGTANEFDSGKQGDATGQQHGETAQGEVAIQARLCSRHVPAVKLPALGLVMNVVEETVLRNQQGVALERPL